MLTEIQLQVDDSILLSLKEGKEAFTKAMLYHYALWLYRQNKLSLGKAAELAGYTRISFIQKLQVEGEAIFDYDGAFVDELIQQAQTTPCIQSRDKK